MIDLKTPLQTRIQNELEDAKGYKWIISKDDLADDLIQIDLDKASVQVYRRHIQRLDPQTQADFLKTIQKIEKKIESAEQTANYLLSNSHDADPRVLKTRLKTENLDLHNPNTLRTIKKYTQRLNKLGDQEPNQKTMDQILLTQNLLNKSTIAFLRMQPVFKFYKIPNNYLLSHYHNINAEIDLCMQKGREQVSIDFLCHMLKEIRTDKMASCRVAFIQDLINNGHRQARKHVELKAVLNYPSLSFIFEQNRNNEDFCRVEIGQDNQLLPPNPKPDRIAESLHAILRAKKKNNLTNVAALIRLGDRHLMLSIDSDDLIYLFNQYGEKENCHYPYLAVAGDLAQAADLLHAALTEQLQESPFKGPITIAAVCNAKEVQHNEINRLHYSILPPPNNNPDLNIHPLPFTMEQFAPPIFLLQKAIVCLSLRTDEGFDNAVAELSQLDTFGFCSPINGDKDKQILDRIYFQLYHIQNKETPSKINRKDSNWGTNAFQSDVLSTPDEKLRAAQRVQVEILLFSLDSCFQDRNEAATPLVLDALEKLVLHVNDLPHGQKNLSHCLFGKLYNIYLAAWKENQQMVHPHDRSFKGDFGRNAFIGEAKNSIPMQYKIQAFQELIKSLKETWKI